VKPKLSFVVPCYNEQDWLPKLLLSLNECNTTFKDIEFVVVDNASTDKTVEVLWALIPSLQFKVRLVHELRKGVSHARNTGAKVAQADIFVFIDSDIRLTQAFVDHLWSVTGQPDFGGATIRTLAEPGSVKGTLVFYVLEFIKMVFPKAFGKSVATRDGFETIGGFDTDVKLGENVIFASGLKHYAKTTHRTFHHISSPIFCSLRRFEKLGYFPILIPWFIAYLGERRLPYATVDEV
jgi:glycosyltransferase involved in cell wall biosynthesis